MSWGIFEEGFVLFIREALFGRNYKIILTLANQLSSAPILAVLDYKNAYYLYYFWTYTMAIVKYLFSDFLRCLGLQVKLRNSTQYILVYWLPDFALGEIACT